MNRRSIVAIVVVGAAVAFVGRFVGRPTEPRPAPPTSPSETRPSMPSGTATVIVFDDGNPARDRTVVFGDDNGAVLATAKTAQDGSVSGPMTARGMVTVAHGTSVRHLITVMAVAPGDRLVVGEEEEEEGTAHVECRLAVAIPSMFPKAARHVISVGVNDTAASDPSTPTTLAVLKRFLVGGKVRAVARALDENGRSLAYAHALVEGCARPDGGPAPTITTKLPPWSTDFRTFTVEATGSEHGTLEGSLTLVPPGADAFPLGKRETPLAGAAKLELLAPRPLGVRGTMKIEVEYEDGHDHVELEERRETLSETTKIDVDERMLPRIRNAVVDGQGTPRPTVRWTTARALAGADAIVARLAWPASREHVWTIIAPPDVPSRLVVPALPGELASWRPDDRAITVAVGAVDASFWDGYADVKKKGLESLEAPPAADVITIRSSASGELEF